MTALVVDASVALKWLLPEPDSAEAEAVVKSGVMLHAPGFLLIETVNAVWKNWRKGLVDPAVVAAAGSKLREFIDIWHKDEGLIGAAAGAAVALNHPIYDCLYLTLAEELGERIITADNRLLSVAPAGTVVALADWIREPPAPLTPPPPVSP